MALIVLGAIGIVGALHERRTASAHLPPSATGARDSLTRTASAGELALPAGARPPVVNTTGPATVARPPATEAGSEARAAGPAAARRASPSTSTTGPARPSTTVAGGRSSPSRAGFARTHADSLALCRSPALPDQRACLSASLADHDRGLNNIYRTLIGEMRKQAGVPPGATDPPSVARLRAEQRAWLEQRDVECRRLARDEGPLWAVPRARCLGSLGTRRAAVFADALTRLRAP